jgi:hypothetical protein
MAVRRLTGIALAAALLAGCGGGGATGTPTGPGRSAGSPGASTVSATSPALPSPPGSPGTAVPSLAVPGRDVPPDGLLSAEGGDPVRGQLGTFVWLGGGSDGPWLPGAPIAVGAGEPLTVGFEPDGDVASWRARYVAADQADPFGARPLGDGLGAPAFPAPMAGSWTAEVVVTFQAGVGSASYFWRLDVR